MIKKYLWLACCVTLLGAALMNVVTGAGAAGLFDPATRTDDAVGNQRAVTDRQAIRSRIVRINSRELSRHVVPSGIDTAPNRAAFARRLDGIIRVELFPDTIVTFQRTDVQPNAGSGFVWEGSADQPFSDAVFIVEDGTVNGRIQLGRRLFRIDPVAGRLHRVTELDASAFPPEAPPLVGPGSADRLRAAPEFIRPQAVVTVRVLVAYTEEAVAESPTGIGKEINRAIALSNQAYRRGKIPMVLELAGKMRVTGYDEGDNFSQNLSDLTGGAAFRRVRNRRNSLGADLVSLFRRASGSACGIAWVPFGSPMPMPGPGTEGTGYSVMARNCVDNLSFHHELGHNMGLYHDRYVMSPASNGVYNYGYVNLGARIRTVLAYNNACADRGFFCTRVNWFSSPTVKGQPGDLTIGIARNDPGAADNTLRLKQTRTAVSNYKPPPAGDAVANIADR